jgi:hypothetical protein
MTEYQVDVNVDKKSACQFQLRNGQNSSLIIRGIASSGHSESLISQENLNSRKDATWYLQPNSLVDMGGVEPNIRIGGFL